MKFILVADNEQVLKDFFPLWQVLLVVIVSLLLLVLLIPKNLLEKTLNSEHTPARLIYLKAFSSREPEYKALKLSIIEQEIDLGLIPTAKENISKLKALDPKFDTSWLDYLVIRYYALNLEPNTPARFYYLKELAKISAKMQNMPLTVAQEKILAADNIALGKLSRALEIYNNLFKQQALTTIDDLVFGAAIAKMANKPSEAAKFYQAASLKSTTLLEKRRYALEAIKSYWADNMPDKAVDYAKTLPNNITDDLHMLAILWQVTMAASKPDLAETYALRALLLNPPPKKSSTLHEYWQSISRWLKK